MSKIILVINLKKSYLKVSVSAKILAICSIGIGEYLGISMGGNFGICAALV